MAERITMLSGVNSPEFFDPGLFRNYIDTLQGQGLLKIRQTGENELELEIDAPRLRAIAQQAIELVDIDVLQAIQQLIGRSRPAIADTRQ